MKQSVCNSKMPMPVSHHLIIKLLENIKNNKSYQCENYLVIFLLMFHGKLVLFGVSVCC